MLAPSHRSSSEGDAAMHDEDDGINSEDERQEDVYYDELMYGGNTGGCVSTL